MGERTRAYFGEYKCGCVSPYFRQRREVLDYCATHGDSRRYVHDVMVTDEQVESCGDWVPAAATKGEG